MFVPLIHPPGHGQADFGEARAVIGGIARKAHFFVFDLPHSDACYVRACPAATAEAWMDGHVHAFAFFGGVPRSVLYDNDRCLVSPILADGTRKRAGLFNGFLSHCLVHDRYGRPGKGNDKGAVEGLAGFARRNFMVPLPRFASREEFNLRLEEQCHSRQGDILRGLSTPDEDSARGRPAGFGLSRFNFAPSTDTPDGGMTVSARAPSRQVAGAVILPHWIGPSPGLGMRRIRDGKEALQAGGDRDLPPSTGPV